MAKLLQRLAVWEILAAEKIGRFSLCGLSWLSDDNFSCRRGLHAGSPGGYNAYHKGRRSSKTKRCWLYYTGRAPQEGCTEGQLSHVLIVEKDAEVLDTQIVAVSVSCGRLEWYDTPGEITNTEVETGGICRSIHVEEGAMILVERKIHYKWHRVFLKFDNEKIVGNEIQKILLWRLWR